MLEIIDSIEKIKINNYVNVYNRMHCRCVIGRTNYDNKFMRSIEKGE